MYVQDLALQGEDGLESTVTTLLGRAPCRVTLDEEYLRVLRRTQRTVGQLAWQGTALKCTLAPDQILGLTGGCPRLGGLHCLLDDMFGSTRRGIKVLSEFLVDGRAHDALSLAVAELGLCLTLELGFGNLDRDDGRQALAEVFAGEVDIFLRHVVGRRIRVKRARQCAAKTRDVRTAFNRVDVVDVREQVLAVARVVFKADVHDRLDTGLIGHNTAHEDGLGDGRGIGIQVAHKVHKTATVGKYILLPVALVLKRDGHIRIQKCQLTQTF